MALLGAHRSSWVQKHIFYSSRPTLINHHQRSAGDTMTEQVESLPIPRCIGILTPKIEIKRKFENILQYSVSFGFSLLLFSVCTLTLMSSAGVSAFI